MPEAAEYVPRTPFADEPILQESVKREPEVAVNNRACEETVVATVREPEFRPESKWDPMETAPIGAKPPVQVAASAEPIPAPAVTEVEEQPFNAASRLGGLRNLMVSLGMKNLHKEAELRHASESEVTFEQVPERPVYAQPDSPEAEGWKGNGIPALVKAQPEIIPPRLAVVEATDREKELSRAVKSPQVSRWDSPDDVEILPSRRGQYRKRH